MVPQFQANGYGPVLGRVDVSKGLGRTHAYPPEYMRVGMAPGNSLRFAGERPELVAAVGGAVDRAGHLRVV
jgi:hypothetical protein